MHLQAEPMFKEQRRHKELADPRLQGDFHVRGLSQAVAVAAMCLQEEASMRPMMTDVVTALSFLVSTGAERGSTQATTIPTPHQESVLMDYSILDKEIVEDRQRAVQEAIEWGTNSRNNQMFRHEPTESL